MKSLVERLSSLRVADISCSRIKVPIKISPERRARIEALKKRIEDYFQNRTTEEKAEDDRRNKEISDAWSVVDGDGLDKE